ncbi:FAD:protein FMN transferase [Ferrimonas sp.]|uniref:FAD:protein FMN transferase n=1 Tax=Ferrimonas sp. TaxID=2080861 RepID=UPI003A8DD687
MTTLAEKTALALTLTEPGLFRGRFGAMACRCELLIRTHQRSLAQQVLGVAAREALRIEHKFSRYSNDGLCHAINHSQGKPVSIDQETHQLLSLADAAWRLSEGLFDISSGILGKVWHFDGSSRLPAPERIPPLLDLIGWDRVTLGPSSFILPSGMAIDFGGLGKEYAVDRVLALCRHHWPGLALLVNFGGDIAVTPTQAPWRVGVSAANGPSTTDALLLSEGAIATSGDTERYLIRDGKRLSHILNPKTGYPVESAPASVTVQAPRCTDAGLIATLAMLHGEHAEQFLGAQGLPFRVQRLTDEAR